jgi:hypothetical protein
MNPVPSRTVVEPISPPPDWPWSTIAPSASTSIHASRWLMNRHRSVWIRTRWSPSSSGGGSSKCATPTENGSFVRPSTASDGIHDTEVIDPVCRIG